MALPGRLVNSYPAFRLGSPIPKNTAKPLCRWHDGRSFSRRVQVTNSAGEHVFYAHAELAFKMCKSRIAGIGTEYSAGGPIRSIFLLRTPGKPVMPVSLRPFGGGYVYQENLGPPTEWAGLWTYAFRYIPRGDLITLRKALDDCFKANADSV